MRIWTAHEKPGAPPVLVREGFCFGAMVFGPAWLAAHRAWWAAAIASLLLISIVSLTRLPASAILLSGVALAQGFSGFDLVRWSLARRGYLESAVVTGRSQEAARSRLFAARPDLVEREMVAEAAP